MKNNDIEQNLELNLEELSEQECDAVVGGMMKNGGEAKGSADGGGGPGVENPSGWEVAGDAIKVFWPIFFA